MELDVDRIELLLLIAALVAMLSRRFRFPYTVGLVISGVALSFLPFVQPVTMTRELLFSVLLPPLIFEAALFLPWQSLRRQMPVVVLIATVGLLLAAFVTGVGLHLLMGWPLLSAAVFAVLIAATDPVSVIAAFKEARITGRLRLLVEAESLFNDGTAAVLFVLLVAVAEGGSTATLDFVGNALWIVGGGIACGGILALAVLHLAGRTTDHLVEITLTTISAYGSFLLAERLHCSGILATLTAGLVVGNRGPLGTISDKGREAAEAFWEYAAFVSNSVIFLLIGLQVARQDFREVWGVAFAAIVLVTLGRAAAIYPLSLLFSRGSLRISRAYQHVMFWGGLRGALALALAEGLRPAFPLRGQIISAAFGVVAFSVLVQGLTMMPLLRRLKLLPGNVQVGDASTVEK